MHRCVRSALLVLVAVNPAFAQRGEPNASQFGWLASLDAGKAEARKTGKPLLVAIRCVP